MPIWVTTESQVGLQSGLRDRRDVRDKVPWLGGRTVTRRTLRMKPLRGGCFGCAPKTRQELYHPRFDDALHRPEEWSERPVELLLGQNTTATRRVVHRELMVSGHGKHPTAPADQLGIFQGGHPAGECQLDERETGCGSGDGEPCSLLKPRLMREVQIPRAPSRPKIYRHKYAPHSLPRGCNRDAC